MAITPASLDELMARLSRYAFDDPAAVLPFSARLAQQNRWTTEFTARAIDEYKRFVCLATCAGHVATPSDAVDQVWHLHMTYSVAYWREFCPQVLGQALHHSPTRGGSRELGKHVAAYAQTLASYRRYFGCEPPRDIWPAVSERFASHRFSRVDLSQHLLIPHPGVWLERLLGVRFVHSRLAQVLWFLTGCAALLTGCVRSPFDLKGPEFLWFVLVAWGFTMVTSLVLGTERERQDELTPQLSFAEVACLAGQSERTLVAAVVELMTRGYVEFNVAGELTQKHRPAEDTDPFLQSVWRQIGSRVRAIKDLTELRDLSDGTNLIARRRLRALGLLAQPMLVRTRLGLELIAPCLGLIKIFVGIARDKPVGFLVMFCLATTASALYRAAKVTAFTPRGGRVLADLMQFDRSGAGTSESHSLAIWVALMGGQALMGTELAPLMPIVMPRGTPSHGGDSNSGGGCGGGGDGGGGGGGGGSGCGGCGGS